MRKSLELSSKISEVRQALNEFAGVDEPTDEQVDEAERRAKELSSLEKRYRVALATEDEEEQATDRETPDAEAREWDRMLNGASVGSFIKAASDGMAPTGVEAEIHQHLKLPPNQFPLDILETRSAPVEQRADAATPSPSDIGANQNSIGGRVFARTAASRVGYSFPTVGPGEQQYPYLVSSGTAPAPYAADAEVDSTAGSFSVETVGPKRLGARVTFRTLDAVKLAGIEEALRADVQMALSEVVDKQLLTGNGVDPNLEGILLGLADANTSTAVATYASIVKDLGAQIDGKYAHNLSDLTLVAHPGLRQFVISLFRANETEATAEEFIDRRTGGFITSANMPAKAANKETCLVHRRGSGLAVTAVAPTWRGVEVVRDNLTSAAKGWIHLNFSLYMGAARVRDGAYGLLKFKTA